MNAVVNPSSGELVEYTPEEQTAAVAIESQIEASTGKKVLIPLVVAQEAFKYNNFGKQAIAQVDKAVLDSPEKFGLAGDLMKAINQNIKAAGEARKSRTDKVNTLVSYITTLFRPGIEKLEKAKADLQKKLNAYHDAEEKKRIEQADKDKKAAEETALALAATQQAMGDNKGADQVMDQAAKAVEKIASNTQVRGHGAYGSTSSAQKRWVGKVDEPALFLAALISIDPSKILDYVDFRQSALNALAKRLGESEAKKSINGFTYEQDKNVRVR